MHDSGSLCSTATCRCPPAVLDALLEDHRAFERTCMQDPACGRPRINLPRTWVHKGVKKGRGPCYAPVLRKRRSPLVLCRFSLAAPSLVVYLEEPHLLL